VGARGRDTHPVTTRRLFVAVPLDPGLTGAIAALVARIRADRVRVAPDERDVRWVRMDGLHLTLRFLGPTPDADVPTVAAAVRRAASTQDPFEVRIDGGGSFPNPRRPRTLWLAVTNGTAELESLARAVDRELVAAGWPSDDRPYRAHLTVARSDGVPAGADVARRLTAAAEGVDLTSAADRLVLFESITGGGPARYEPLESTPLLHRPSPAR
jgi:RNA 2',3'-cyclic 3'-phosphodiesterase